MSSKQEGISFLLIDMKSPGVSVEPIITMDGGHYLNNVFLDEVRVPVSDRVGEENKGWTYAKFLLGYERTGIAGVGRSKHRLARLKEIALSETSGGEPLLRDPDFSRKIARLEIELRALEITNLRALADQQANEGRPSPVSSILKIKGTEIEQTINALLVEALGYYAVPYAEEPRPESNLPYPGPEHGRGVVAEHLLRRASSIYGGTNEIQKNIIAKAVLGL